jgi:hypothetical protein
MISLPVDKDGRYKEPNNILDIEGMFGKKGKNKGLSRLQN